ncbi:MAG: hypothetical protein GY940_03545 [bacterium]|nr:hypothetical protein [bacterium]
MREVFCSPELKPCSTTESHCKTKEWHCITTEWHCKTKEWHCNGAKRNLLSGILALQPKVASLQDESGALQRKVTALQDEAGALKPESEALRLDRMALQREYRPCSTTEGHCNRNSPTDIFEEPQFNVQFAIAYLLYVSKQEKNSRRFKPVKRETF